MPTAVVKQTIEVFSSGVPQKPLSVLYAAAGIAAFSAIAYELLLASYATFLMGASVIQYSLVLSVMMASMGGGALLAEKLKNHPIEYLVGVEIALSWIAIATIPLLYFSFAQDLSPRLLMIGFVIAIGSAIGMEIPLINQIHPTESGLNRILFFDYLGGFLGGLIFPLWLQPKLGFFRVAGILAITNALIAACLFVAYHERLPYRRKFWIVAISLAVLLSFTFCLASESLRIYMERTLFRISPIP